MTPAAFTLLVLACPPLDGRTERDCVAVVAEVESVAACRALFQEIKATLPQGLVLTFPECVSARRQAAQKEAKP